MNDWTIEDSLETYNIPRWGEGYFGINDAGHVIVTPDPVAGGAIDLYAVGRQLRDAGLPYPVLVRIPAILHRRVEELCHAFDGAIAAEAYDGGYTPVYPIKVNQNRNVVEELLPAAGGRIGLEAGSKPELLAVMALSRPGGIVICNGYKDREYVRLALAGLRMGLRVYLVLEKPSELPLVIEEARRMGVSPRLGMRMKLAAVASGKWQNSGGQKSKFGLTTTQVLAAVDDLQATGMLDCLQLLHLHLGSQMSTIRDIQNGLTEAARFYIELHRRGAPLRIVDVGGGLGIDYEGTRTRSDYSMDYTVDEYAAKVVHVFAQACRHEGLPMPDLLSESGRAMTAHHAVLITNVTEIEARSDLLPPEAAAEHERIRQMRALLARLDREPPLREVYHDAVFHQQEAQAEFALGHIDIGERAAVEQLYLAICLRIFRRLKPDVRTHRQIFEELEDILADKVFCNFSLFQSMPDVWAIDQVFPVVPLHRLDERPARRAVLHDLTCDSDGRIDYYVDRDGIETTLPVHGVAAGEEYLLGMFLVGAYQETLGDIHNLFGDTAAVNVRRDADGTLLFEHAYQGETVRDLLTQVDFDADEVRRRIVDRARASGLPADEVAEMVAELEASLDGYSYLEE